MKHRKNLIIIAFSVLVLVGCSGGSDDGGGTVGGSGLLPYCERDAGVYNYADGSTLKVNPNCEFVMTMADGNRAHGKVNSVGEDGSISLDMVIDTGPSAGTCATVSGKPNGSINMTNISQCT